MKPGAKPYEADETTRLGVVTVERELLFDLIAHCIAARRQLELIDAPNLAVAAAAATANVNHIGARLAQLARARYTYAMFAPPADSRASAPGPAPASAELAIARARAATVDLRPRQVTPAPPARVFCDRPVDEDASEDRGVLTSARLGR